ncbi:site-2 protease family protein [Yoonia sp.]|uniref:site-2 protease family protein n=1 Tax=Yoonia sp. TaxID=2212373 RepID=UPI0025E581D4|nr:site-2 protease family protein [Yoonia sp.]
MPLRGLTIFSLFGYDIKVDVSWFFIAALVVWSLAGGYFPSVVPDASTSQIVVLAVLAMLGLFASLILHELSHSLVARRCGVTIKGITLFIFGGVAELASEPPTAGTEFWIALAGPAASLALAFVFWIAAAVAQVAEMPASILALLSYMALANLILGIFNMLPAFPLDGGRVLRAVLWNRSGDQLRATEKATAIGSVFAYLLIGLGSLDVVVSGQFGGLWIVIIGLFILASGKNAYQNMRIHAALRDKTVSEIMTPRPLTISPDETLQTLVDHYILSRRVGFVPVVEGTRVLGYIDVAVLSKIDREHWPRTAVGDVYVEARANNMVAPTDNAEAVLSRIATGPQRKFLVVSDGQLRGVITLSDLIGYLSLLQTLQTAPSQVA